MESFLSLGTPQGWKTVKIDFVAPIVSRILWGISWWTGDQDPVWKLSDRIHDSSPVQEFNHFRSYVLANEISKDLAIETRFFWP
jgi:hypothetical protein